MDLKLLSGSLCKVFLASQAFILHQFGEFFHQSLHVCYALKLKPIPPQNKSEGHEILCSPMLFHGFIIFGGYEIC